MKKLLLTFLIILFSLTSNPINAAPDLPTINGAIPGLQNVSGYSSCVGTGVKAYKYEDYRSAVKIWEVCAKAREPRIFASFADFGHIDQSLFNNGFCYCKSSGYAMNNLGHMYYHGLGVRQDDELALKWLRLAKGRGVNSKMIMEIEEQKRERAAEKKRIVDINKTKRTIDIELQTLKDNLEKLQDLELDSLKVQADQLMSEIANNPTSDLLTLVDYRDSLYSLNSSVRSSIKTEEKRIADIRKEQKIIVIELNKLNDNLKKLQDLELDSLKVQADQLTSEILTYTPQDLLTLVDYRDRLYNLNSLVASTIKAEEKRIADAKKAEEKRIADAKKAEEKRIAEELLNKKLALIPPQTALKKAQNFLSDIQVFVASNPDEFDIFEIATFTMNTKLISEGVADDEQMNTIELFKEFVKTSSAFIEFEEKQQDARNQIELKKIDRVIKDLNRTIKRLQSFTKVNLTPNSVSLIDEKIKSSQLIIDNPKTLSELENAIKELTILLSDLAAEEKRIADAKKAEEKRIADAKKAEKELISDINSELSRIDQHINKLKIYLTENLSSISPELVPLILEKVKVLKTNKNENNFNNKSEELKALRKVNEEISNFMLDNNIVTKAEEKRKAEESKRVADAKKAEEKKKAAEEKRIAANKRKEKEIEGKHFFVTEICGEPPLSDEEVSVYLMMGIDSANLKYANRMYPIKNCECMQKKTRQRIGLNRINEVNRKYINNPNSGKIQHLISQSERDFFASLPLSCKPSMQIRVDYWLRGGRP